MKLRVTVLGAGFGGLELTSILSKALGEQLDLTLIDQNDSFAFGASKLDVMFGRKSADSVRISYRKIHKPGVRFHQETILSIDPQTCQVVTDHGTYDADILVVALGADYDLNATPGLREGDEGRGEQHDDHEDQRDPDGRARPLGGFLAGYFDARAPDGLGHRHLGLVGRPAEAELLLDPEQREEEPADGHQRGDSGEDGWEEEPPGCRGFGRLVGFVGL